MNPTDLADQAARLAQQAAALAQQAARIAQQAAHQAASGQIPLGQAAFAPAAAAEPFVTLLAVFLLACFVGYHVVWSVTPALHSPLMGVTNAISSVVVVGAMLATGLATDATARWFGFAAVLLASVNIFGGFVVTGRMLAMFRGRGPAKPGTAPAKGH